MSGSGCIGPSGCWRRICWLASPSSGVIATRVLRCAGAATAVGLLALVIRVGLIELFDADMLQFVAWVAALLPLLAIDIWAYYCRAIRQREPGWRGTAAVLIAAMAINALVIRSLYNLGDSDNLSYAAAVIVTGIGMSWFANRVAQALLRQREPAQRRHWRSQEHAAGAIRRHNGCFSRLHFLLHHHSGAAPLSWRKSGILRRVTAKERATRPRAYRRCFDLAHAGPLGRGRLQRG